jgi:hypothetical protein
MTAYAFKVRDSDPRAASKWYPGDAYVNNVAGDAYNWSTCRGGSVQQLSTVASGLLTFARAHHKGAVLGEYATGAGAARAPWLRNAAAFLIQNDNTFRAAYYFDHVNRTNCQWGLTSSADVNTFTSLSKDGHFTR